MQKLRPYNEAVDAPKTSRDALSVVMAAYAGKRLYIDQNGAIWAAEGKEYIGQSKRKVVR